MTGVTDDEGLAVAGCHHFDPGRFLLPSRSTQVLQRSDMVHFYGFGGTAQFASSSLEPLHKF